MQIVWTSPLDDCQTCGAPFDSVMYDASVHGRWGNICQHCFDAYGCSLGTGLGQRYELQPRGEALYWVKVAG